MLKLFRYLKNYKKESIIGPLFKLIEACFELAVPIVMANIIDVGIKNQDKPYIYKMGGVLVLLAFCGLACALTAQYFAAKASLGFGTALRRDLFKHINSLSYAEIDTNDSGYQYRSAGCEYPPSSVSSFAFYRAWFYHNGILYLSEAYPYLPDNRTLPCLCYLPYNAHHYTAV